MSYAIQNARLHPKAAGNVIIESKANILQLDLDENAIKQAEVDLIQRLEEFGLLEPPCDNKFLITVSPGGNRHLYIWLDRGLSLAQRIALQLLGGSDPVRELLSLMRELTPGRESTPELCLFETPKEARRYKAWLNGLHTVATRGE